MRHTPSAWLTRWCASDSELMPKRCQAVTLINPRGLSAADRVETLLELRLFASCCCQIKKQCCYALCRDSERPCPSRKGLHTLFPVKTPRMYHAPEPLRTLRGCARYGNCLEHSHIFRDGRWWSKTIRILLQSLWNYYSRVEGAFGILVHSLWIAIEGTCSRHRMTVGIVMHPNC